MAGTALTFDSLNMNSSSVTTTDFEDGNSPERILELNRLYNQSGGVIGDDSWYTKAIPARGSIQGSSVSNLETLIDTFLTAMARKNKNLDVGYAGGTRRYVATPQGIRVTRGHRSMVWADWELEFLVTGFGKDTSTTTLVNAQTHTTASKTNALTVAGSAPEQMLRTQITVTAATGLEGKTISVENDTTGELLSVTRDWTVGEVLVVDYANLLVTVNGVEVDFSGAFPNFAPGTHNHIISNDFTTRTLTVTIDHVRRYM